MPEADLTAIMNGLVAAWCDRRDLRALRFILAGWPMVSTLSDEWHQLHGALRDVRAIRGLPEQERDRVDEALRIVETALRSVGQRPRWRLFRRS